MSHGYRRIISALLERLVNPGMLPKLVIAIVGVTAGLGYAWTLNADKNETASTDPAASEQAVSNPKDAESKKGSEMTERAVLAGGCFWGMQDLIRKRPGIVDTRVGYSGGDVPNATYRNHGTHAEAIEINFDPNVISYRELLAFFFQIHDPTTPNRQGNDRGAAYRSAIYYTSEDQKQVALDTIADVDASGLWPGKVVTEVEPVGDFWEAEPEHQDYLERIPNGYTCHFPRPDWVLPRRDAAKK